MCRKFAARLAECFAAINATIEARNLAQMLVDESFFVSFHFEVDEETVRRLVVILSKNQELWLDFQQAIRAHRRATHWTALSEHVFTVGQLQGKLQLLERGLSCPAADDRLRLAEYLNCIDGEIGFCRDLADRRDLAKRINQDAGFPVIDGLALRGLTYVLGEHSDLWRDFQALVDTSVRVVRDRHTIGVDASRSQP